MALLFLLSSFFTHTKKTIYRIKKLPCQNCILSKLPLHFYFSKLSYASTLVRRFEVLGFRKVSFLQKLARWVRQKNKKTGYCDLTKKKQWKNQIQILTNGDGRKYSSFQNLKLILSHSFWRKKEKKNLWKWSVILESSAEQIFKVELNKVRARKTKKQKKMDATIEFET